MTIDKSLRISRGSVSNRSVLTRAERLQRLADVDRWREGDSPLGIPKVRVYKLSMKKKKKKKEEGEEGAAAAPAAKGAKGAATKGAATKGAAPKGATPKGGGAKGAAPKK